MASTSSSRAKRKYNEKNYVRVHLQVKPEVKEDWLIAAASAGESLTMYIVEAMAQRMEREKKK